jgi:predicted nucleic acid-binding protein
MKVLCDTNVLSELARPAPDPGVLRWALGVKVIGLSAIVVDEICFGLSARPNPRIQTWFDGFLREHCVVFPVTEAIARRSGGLRGRLRAAGVTRTQADMLIASTALEHDLTLVTRNTRDFEGCGLSLLDPFGKKPQARSRRR